MDTELVSQTFLVTAPDRKPMDDFVSMASLWRLLIGATLEQLSFVNPVTSPFERNGIPVLIGSNANFIIFFSFLISFSFSSFRYQYGIAEGQKPDDFPYPLPLHEFWHRYSFRKNRMAAKKCYPQKNTASFLTVLSFRLIRLPDLLIFPSFSQKPDRSWSNLLPHLRSCCLFCWNLSLFPPGRHLPLLFCRPARSCS